MKKQRAGRTPSVSNRTRSVTGTKRKAKEITEDMSNQSPVDIVSENEGSGFETPTKQAKKEIPVRDEFVSRYVDKAIGSRVVLMGRPINDSFVHDSGVLKLFNNIGMSPLLTDSPTVCYPDLIREFYGNLHVDDKGKYVSFVNGIKMNLNSVILGEILGLKSVGSVSVYKKRGSVSLDNFSALDQLKVVRGISDLNEFVNPTTSQVLPMAHLLFRICIANLCPRMGTKSNFSCQDVTLVSMIMTGRTFDVCDLILNNMLEVTTGSVASGLPYGLLLTRVFEFYGLDMDNEFEVCAKDYLDTKYFGQSGLLLGKDGVVVQVEVQNAVEVGKEGTSATTSKVVSFEGMERFMAEVMANGVEIKEWLVRMEAESVKLHKKIDMVVDTLKLQQVSPEQLDAIVKAACQILEDKSATEGPAPGVSTVEGKSDEVVPKAI